MGNNGAASLKTLTVWMGGLFNPEAFVTATRQCVAQVSTNSEAKFSKISCSQCCGSGSGLDPDSVRSVDLDSESGSLSSDNKNGKK